MPSETYIKHPRQQNFDGKRVLNLGCGKCTYPYPNVVNVDAVSADEVNLVWDLSQTPLPLPTGEFDLIIANHVLEHIPDWWNLVKEASRLLKTNGVLEIWVPPVSSDSAFTYRDHINRIGLLSFAGTYTAQNAGANLVVEKEIKESVAVSKLALLNHSLRPVVRWWLHFAPDWFLDFCVIHLRNTVSEEGFFFRKMP